MRKTIHSASDGIALKLKVLAKEKEDVRRKLVVTAREKEDVRSKLVITAEKLRLKATQFAATAKEKEVVRRKLVITADELRMSRKTLEKKVLERTKDLEKVRAKDEAILASIGEGLVATDKNGRILLVNKACERLLGWKEGETQGKLLSKVIPMSDSTGKTIPALERLITKTLKDRSTTTTTTTMYYKRKDGTSFPVALTVAPIFIGKDLIGAVKVFRDITKEKEIEKARSEFMSIASHQLRTPLTAIRWVLSSLKRGNLTEEQTKLEKISRLHDAHRQRNGLELALQCPEDLMVRTDKQLLIEILDNLLSNALKYTPRGGKVNVSVAKEGESIRIDVADTGYGIPQEEQKRIPEKFFRASNVASPVEAGTGIGLYMVYNIVRLIGGTISFVSQENKGTTFTLLFPS